MNRHLARFAALATLCIVTAGCSGVQYGQDPLHAPIGIATLNEISHRSPACDAVRARIDAESTPGDKADRDRAIAVRHIADEGLFWTQRCHVSDLAKIQLRIFFRMNRAWSAAKLGKDPHRDIAYGLRLFEGCSRIAAANVTRPPLMLQGAVDKAICDWNHGTVYTYNQSMHATRKERSQLDS